MKDRIFIVAPQYDGDTLYVVCKSKSRNSLLDIYFADKYEELGNATKLHDAKKIAWWNGAKRPTII
jgi:hypothetical protein